MLLNLLPILATKWHGRNIIRSSEEEDDNTSHAAKQDRKRRDQLLSPTWISRQTHRLIPTPNTREVDGLTTPPTHIEVRHFKWVITSILIPAEYHPLPTSDVNHAPWRMMIRFLLTDLPAQIQDDDAGDIPWRQHPVGPLMPVSWPSLSHVHMNMTGWGYQAVYLQESNASRKPRSLVGSWLVVVYVCAKDRKWLSTLDERSLMTSDNLYNMVAFEQCFEDGKRWSGFWGYKGNKFGKITTQRKAASTTTDSAKARRLCELLDKKAIFLLFGKPSERPVSNLGTANSPEADQK